MDQWIKCLGNEYCGLHLVPAVALTRVADSLHAQAAALDSKAAALKDRQFRKWADKSHDAANGTLF